MADLSDDDLAAIVRANEHPDCCRVIPRRALRAAIAADRALNAAQAAAVRHIRTGGVYTHLGEAVLQTDKPLEDMVSLQVYAGADGKLWARDSAEFAERFVAAAEQDAFAMSYFGADADYLAAKARQATAAQAAAEPVAWVDERVISWLADHHRRFDASIMTKLEARKSFERPMPLYAATPQQAAPVAPAGWRMVPVEPTYRMLRESLIPAAEAARYYARMLAAAPQPASELPNPSP